MKKINMPKFMIRLKVTDDNLLVVNELYEQGHSWTRNGYMLWMACFSGVCGDNSGVFGAGKRASKRTSGTIDSSSGFCFVPYHYIDLNNHFVSSVQNSTGAGICVGTGNTAFDVGNYNLAARISHGTELGKLSYGIQSAVTADYNSSTKEWVLTNTRQFNNASGSDIVIAEMGLDYYGRLFQGTVFQYLVARDVLSTPITVQNGYNVDVAYEITFDFSGID